MLILTRRVQEAIMIGDDVTVTVLSVKGQQVRLGIDAPREIEVHREEIFHRVKNGIPRPETTSGDDNHNNHNTCNANRSPVAGFHNSTPKKRY